VYNNLIYVKEVYILNKPGCRLAASPGLFIKGENSLYYTPNPWRDPISKNKPQTTTLMVACFSWLKQRTKECLVDESI